MRRVLLVLLLASWPVLGQKAGSSKAGSPGGSAASPGVSLQSSSPGTAQTGSIAISGTIVTSGTYSLMEPVTGLAVNCVAGGGTLSAGTRHYLVVPVDPASNEGPIGTEVTGVLSATGHCDLSWTAYTGSSLGYDVYYGTVAATPTKVSYDIYGTFFNTTASFSDDGGKSWGNGTPYGGGVAWELQTDATGPSVTAKLGLLNSLTTTSFIAPGTVTYAHLTDYGLSNTAPLVYCTDCKVTSTLDSTCLSSGAGALAFVNTNTGKKVCIQ